MVRCTTLLALTVSILICVVPPVLYFHHESQNVESGLHAEAMLNSRQVSRFAVRNPEMWTFESHRLEEMIDTTDIADSQTIFDRSGNVVLHIGQQDLGWPSKTVYSTIHDAGMPVGELAVSVSLISVFWQSLLVLALTSFVATATFLSLRTLPLRVLGKAVDRAMFLASHDPLTTLPNRSLFNDWLKKSLEETESDRREQRPVALLCLDLDHFKEVNDILGHEAGDELLKQVVDRMKECLRHEDFLARLGGDEFAIIQKSASQPDGSTQLAERLIGLLEEPFALCGTDVSIGMSIGIAIHHSGQVPDPQNLLRHADLALYGAKADGRGVCRYFEKEMNDNLAARKLVQNDLRGAIARNELVLYFQPQIDLATGSITGVEALLRWNRRGQGLVMPDAFISLAEETGLIVPIGEWVIQEACRRVVEWPELSVAVNVSPLQFRQGDLIKTIKDALDSTGIEPRRLEIEITESVLLSHTEEAVETMTTLQDLGVRIAMDDFGTGYSSLSYLRRFPFDKIKIDKSFVADLNESTNARSIVEAVIQLGSSMGMVSNAEGVETIEQADLLRNHGCKEVQGFLFSRPLPSESIAEILSDKAWQESRTQVG